MKIIDGGYFWGYVSFFTNKNLYIIRLKSTFKTPAGPMNNKKAEVITTFGLFI